MHPLMCTSSSCKLVYRDTIDHMRDRPMQHRKQSKTLLPSVAQQGNASMTCCWSSVTSFCLACEGLKPCNCLQEHQVIACFHEPCIEALHASTRHEHTHPLHKRLHGSWKARAWYSRHLHRKGSTVGTFTADIAVPAFNDPRRPGMSSNDGPRQRKAILTKHTG